MIHRQIIAIPLFIAATIADAQSNDAVVAHPIFATTYSCTEHSAGELQGLGDELGTDCFIESLVEKNGRTWLRAYRTNGVKNQDWFGWSADVLAPCSGTVKDVQENKITNKPGILGKPPASMIQLNCASGVSFILAHIAAPTVTSGSSVEAGQRIAKVGNNGMSRQPHIHLGAWKDNVPLQIRFDQTKIHHE